MKKPLLLLVPAALLFLASCSSEPSDWRPDQKVSLDQVPPGTRASENYDKGTADEPSNEKGGAIATPSPAMSSPGLEGRAAPKPQQVMTADTKPENAKESAGEGTSSQQANAKEGKE